MSTSDLEDIASVSTSASASRTSSFGSHLSRSNTLTSSTSSTTSSRSSRGPRRLRSSKPFESWKKMLIVIVKCVFIFFGVLTFTSVLGLIFNGSAVHPVINDDNRYNENGTLLVKDGKPVGGHLVDDSFPKDEHIRLTDVKAEQGEDIQAKLNNDPVKDRLSEGMIGKKRFGRRLQGRNLTEASDSFTNLDKRDLESWDGDLTPPDYCYTSPTGKKVKPAPAPRKSALPLKYAKEVLALLGKDRPCMIMSRKCANATTRKVPAYHRYFGAKSKLTHEEKVMKFPILAPGEWGSCAIVGNGDNMLKGQYGKEIDDHDYVARYNVITKPYAKAVGTKVSGMFDKFNYRIGPHKPDRMPTKYHMYPKRTPSDMRADLMKGGVSPLVYGSDKSPWRRDAAAIYEIFKKVKKPKKKDVHPTGGFARVMSMVEMVNRGVCSRLDIYGFSEGGGKYFKRKHTVKTDHIIIAEHFSYRLLMASGVKGKICIYGD